jgi:hypothetical protein
MRLAFHRYIVLLIENQELILAPLMTMLPQPFSLPQFIFSSSFACQEFEVNWQRYFIMYLPQALAHKLYVSPSSFYTNEFHAENLVRKLAKSKVRQIVVRKIEIAFNV